MKYFTACTLPFVGYLLQFLARVSSSSETVKMKVYNHAGLPIELFWVNTFEPAKELVLQSEKPIRNSTHTSVNSYNTHQFIVKFHDNKHTYGDVKGEFVKGPRDEDVNVYFDKESLSFRIKQTTLYDEWIEKVSASTTKCLHSTDDLATCVGNEVFADVSKLIDSAAFMKSQRDTVADKYRNYTCADESLETSKPVKTFNYNHEGKMYKIDTLFDHSHAKIYMAHDFITDEECQKFFDEGKGKLRRATVAGPDGGSVISEHRKAQQAHYSMPIDDWEGDVLWPLYKRAITFANKYGKLNVERPGQEDFTIIQYNPTDEYMPHCDGDCEGQAHLAGGRVATAVLYCQVPPRGGATTFSKADVLVKPKKNSASIFIYKGEDGLMDEGYTEHSGCPVLEGEKWISTIWMREGVTRERDWTKIDPSGTEVLGPDEDPEEEDGEEEQGEERDPTEL